MWCFVCRSSSNTLTWVCYLQSVRLLAYYKFCDKLWTSKWRHIYVNVIQCFTCIVLIKLRDMEWYKFESVGTYIANSGRIKTVRFLLSVSIQVWMFPYINSNSISRRQSTRTCTHGKHVSSSLCLFVVVFCCLFFCFFFCCCFFLFVCFFFVCFFFFFFCFVFFPVVLF